MLADKDKVTRLLKTARGQLDGLLKMVEEDRYCVDISNQLMATQAILIKVNSEIMNDHLGH
ncbi:MAG: metal-sensing transcriptional repressor [Oscillospiraceae bacterium]